MKVQDIITEAKSKYDPVDFANVDLQKLYVTHGKKIVAFIKKNCKPWMKEVGNSKNRVYRGFNSVDSGKLAFTKVTRPDRKPKDSSKRDHDIMNQIIDVAGKTANRSNSMFVSGEYDVAVSYGSAYVVIPIGQFDYTWHTEISDWMDGEIVADAQPGPEDIEIDKDTQQKLVAKLKKQYQAQFVTKKKQVVSPIAEFRKVLAGFGWKGKPKTLTNMLYLWGSRFDNKMDNSYAKSIIKFGKMSDAAADDKIYAAYARAWLASNTTQRAAITKLAKAAVIEAREAYNSYATGISKPATEKAYIAQGLSNYKKKLYNKMPAKNQISTKTIERDIVPKIKGNDGTLSKAIKSGHEIMISSKKVLAINPEIYTSIVIPLLNNKKPRQINPEAFISNDGGEDNGYGW